MDVGEVRIGVATSDPDGRVAVPLVTVPRDREPPAGAVPSDLAARARLVVEYEAVAVVVGLPVNLSGAEGAAARQARDYAARLADLVAPVPVDLSDERMSTAVATRRLAERGVRGPRRRTVVDQAAAAEILQGWLDAQRRRT